MQDLTLEFDDPRILGYGAAGCANPVAGVSLHPEPPQLRTLHHVDVRVTPLRGGLTSDGNYSFFDHTADIGIRAQGNPPGTKETTVTRRLITSVS